MKLVVGVVVAALRCTLVGSAIAHWCSNIFVTRARIIVKPEKTTIFLSSTPTPLRVYLQNNFPYKIRAYMRATSGSTIYPATPSSGYHDVYPGQNVSYIFNVTGSGSTTVDTLNLQMKFRTASSTNPNDWTWRSESDSILDQNPTQSQLVSGTSHSQSGSLSAAMLAERYPSATLGSSSPWFSHTGMQQMIKWFGYRFCWNASGNYRCSSQDCPTPCAEGAGWTLTDQFPHLCMRAGVELGARKASLGSNLAAARDGAVNALKGTGSAQHKCLAAVVGGYLWQGVSATAFTTVLQDAANSVPSICQAAGLRALGQGSASSCASGQHYERAACAGAEGLRNNNSPVTSVLLPNAGDGTTGVTDYDSLYYSYMLYIVQAHRKATTGTVPFYPDAGVSAGCSTAGDCDDSNPCTTDTCVSNACQHTPISGCCTSASQCNDSNPCTNDTCVSNACQHSTITGCCTSATQCNDNNSCTTNACVNNVCQYTPVSGCCTSDADCNDSNPCTTDTCVTATGTCSNVQQTGCCAFDTDCNDNDPCTIDTCTGNVCNHTPICGDAGPREAGPADVGPQETIAPVDIGPVTDQGTGPTHDVKPHGQSMVLEGGCDVGSGPAGVSLVFVLLLLPALVRLRRRRVRR